MAELARGLAVSNSDRTRRIGVGLSLDLFLERESREERFRTTGVGLASREKSNRETRLESLSVADATRCRSAAFRSEYALGHS